MTSTCATSTVKKAATIFWSKCGSIFENLALEEWIFRRHDLDSLGEVMIAWSNTPTVVYGRHQNPFLEANTEFLSVAGIDLARRHSGGGTVFHGHGNINLSIVTTHKNHCRPRNLTWIAEALNSEFGTKITPTKRDDLVFPDGERKVSGTAARIVKGRAYHHLTLLVDEDLDLLRACLKSPFRGRVKTNATESVPAKAIGQLSQDVPGIKIDDVRDVLFQNFALQYETCNIVVVNALDESAFPGVNATEAELRSWDWRFAKSPKFTLDGSTLVENGLITSSAVRPDLAGRPFDEVLPQFHGWAASQTAPLKSDASAAGSRDT
uniref:BPL/LPL catalytic domain-containing protein n=1 Tax=Panagrellus redivivus TaxID=6233 RepID=A0A7E4ZWY9_PANRE